MRLFVAALLASFLPVAGFSGDIDSAKKKIDEIRSEVMKQPQPKELQWNRYVTPNFEILSLDDAQGKYLCDNIEYIKTWISWRWGIKDEPFAARCKVVCVPSADLYQKLFGKRVSFWKAERSDYSVWLVADGRTWNTALPVQLTEIVLFNFEAKYNYSVPVWFHKGSSIVNGRIIDIKGYVKMSSEFSSKTLLETTPESYSSLNESQKVRYDANAATFVLMVRKECGGAAFLNFLSNSGNPLQALRTLGLNSFEECDNKVKEYSSTLRSAPNQYFSW